MRIQFNAAVVADDYRVEFCPAACVRQDHGAGAFGRQPAVTPLRQRKRDGEDIHSLWRKQIFAALGIGLVNAPLQHAVVDQQVQPVGQDVGGDMPASANFLVATITEKERRKNKLRPAIGKDVNRLSERYADGASIVSNVGAAAAFWRRHPIHSGTRAVFGADVVRDHRRAAMRAYNGRRHGVAASRVDQRRRPQMILARPQPIETPEHQCGREEVSPHVRQAIGEAVAVRGRQLLKAAVADKSVEATSENVARDADALMPLVKAAHALKGCADDQQRPAVADMNKSSRYRIGGDHSRRAFCGWSGAFHHVRTEQRLSIVGVAYRDVWCCAERPTQDVSIFSCVKNVDQEACCLARENKAQETMDAFFS